VPKSKTQFGLRGKGGGGGGGKTWWGIMVRKVNGTERRGTWSHKRRGESGRKNKMEKFPVKESTDNGKAEKRRHLSEGIGKR